MSEQLWELESAVQNALDWLTTAQDIASSFNTDIRTGEPLGWPEMGEVQDRLGKATDLLNVALQPIAAAIQAERDADDGRDSPGT